MVLLILICVNFSAFGQIMMGAERFDIYKRLVKNKKVGVVVNHTSLINGQHLVDFLDERKVKVNTIFTPEHGFAGKADAGESVENESTPYDNYKIISLYGDKKKPKKEDLEGLDVVLFDLQDVGVRFYTYISTMHYMMEACAENNISFIVLDRPNPNGMYVDGPVLKKEFTSFVGMHPIPVLHGCTVGELAQMINGEGWLANGVTCDLRIIPMRNYDHSLDYILPVPPSPNLPTPQAVKLYPSLCFFEGTVVSVGRGTNQPFEVIGHPRYPALFSFTPEPNEGAAHPKHQGRKCYGMNLSTAPAGGLTLIYLTNFYEKLDTDKFFVPFFDLLAGTDELRKQIVAGFNEIEIRLTWVDDLRNYKTTRAKYLIYPDK